MNETLTIKFANAEDKANFCRFIAACHEQDGTVTGFRAGIACSALKKSSIMTEAEIAEGKIAVRHSVRHEVNREYLTVDCPNGWDDVKKITKKVLMFGGREFTFTGWTSDRNEAFFCRGIDSTTPTFASIK